MENKRLSLIDGSVEEVVHPPLQENEILVPVIKERTVLIQTLEGPEEVTQKYIAGYIRREREV
jgi:hypothetical protein